MTSVRYTASDLHNMKGQALKDHYHSLIGKPAGLKNTTGLKCSAEIIEAVLRLYEEGVKPSQPPSEEMQAERKKPGRKPKAKESKPLASVVAPTVPAGPVQTLAIESTELPIRNVEVVSIRVKPIHVDGTLYFVESKTNKVYAEGADKRPAAYVGQWDPETKTLEETYE